VNNVESDLSNSVTVTAPVAPTVSGGVGEVSVTGATEGATVTLYDSNGNAVYAQTADGSGSYTFTGVTAGTGYTVRQIVNNVESGPSNSITVT
jgi:hypothetical protein